MNDLDVLAEQVLFCVCFDLPLRLFGTSDMSGNRKPEFSRRVKLRAVDLLGQWTIAEHATPGKTHSDQSLVGEGIPVAMQRFEVLKVNGLSIGQSLQPAVGPTGTETSFLQRTDVRFGMGAAAYVVAVIMNGGYPRIQGFCST